MDFDLTRQLQKTVKPANGKGEAPLIQRVVNPGFNDYRLRCGNCGNFNFKAHVRAIEGTARILELVCGNCTKYFKLDDSGLLQGTGEFTNHEGQKLT